MLRIEELDALDLLVWLQSGTTAAELVGTNQSTICRRASRALDSFQARLVRSGVSWRVCTPLEPLLDLQRLIHQQWRFRSGASLRLEGPVWSRAALRACAPPGWITTPQKGPRVCENPLQLLRAHVLDACLVTPTQLAGQPVADLALFDLYGSHIDLHLVAAVPETAAVGSVQGAQDLLARGQLELLPFLPSSCLDASQRRFEWLRRELGQAGGDARGVPPRQSDVAPRLAFLTPVMASGLHPLRPRVLSLPLEWPYRETLVVLRSSVEQRVVQALVEVLHRDLPCSLQARVPGGVDAIR